MTECQKCATIKIESATHKATQDSKTKIKMKNLSKAQLLLYLCLGIALSLAIFLVANNTQAARSLSIVNGEPTRQSDVHIYEYENQQYQQDQSFLAFDQNFIGGADIALADLGGDGVAEVVVGAGPGGGPEVRIFRADGSFVNSFYAYSETFDKGITVAAGDLDGDGKDEIITGTQHGGGPHVRIFDGYGRPKFNLGFFAYDFGYHGGVNVATADVDGDGKDEIVTGPGTDSGPHVRVFDENGYFTGMDFWPFGEADRGGVSVAGANVDGGAEDEIIMGIRSQGETWVKVYKTNTEKIILGEFKAWPDAFHGGVNLAGGDIDQDGNDEVIAAVHGSGGPQVKFFEAHGEEIISSLFAYEEDFQGGVNVAAGDLDTDKQIELVTVPTKLPPSGRTDLERYVEVVLSEQRMYAYEDGYLANTFLISSGLPQTPTPRGDFQVIRKIYSHLYAGPDYYLPNTLYNMEFTRSYYLHGAYWHNNFGHPMSHGCVNISYTNAAWLFDWVSVGTPVFIHY